MSNQCPDRQDFDMLSYLPISTPQPSEVVRIIKYDEKHEPLENSNAYLNKNFVQKLSSLHCAVVLEYKEDEISNKNQAHDFTKHWTKNCRTTSKYKSEVVRTLLRSMKEMKEIGFEDSR